MTDKILWWEHYENKQTKTIHLVASNFTSHERVENYYKYLYGTITFTSEEDFDYIPNFSFVFQIKYIDLWTLSQSMITKVATSSNFQIMNGKLVGTFEWETPALYGLTPYSVASNTSSATPNYVESPSYDGFMEVQCGNNGFNMGFVIDGTKDTTKVQAFSYTRSEILKPNTLCLHENTNTWWIVNKDKVEKIINDNGTFVYIHNLQLEGAIELLNARDLTDSGFNQKTYTIEQLILRLFKLSSFEISAITIDAGAILDTSKRVDYIKTFENYTLLSALREFLDGYNCAAKLSFARPQFGCTLHIVPKTGDFTRPIKTFEEVFNDVKEIKELSKSSFGTTVVSNTENIVSTKSKIFPNVGFVRASGDGFYIKPDTALIRLPSKVSSVEFVDMLKGKMTVTIGRNEYNYYDTYMNGTTFQTSFDTSDVESYNKAIDWIKSTLLSQGPSRTWVENNTDDEFWNSAKGENALNTFIEYCKCRLYDITEYDPVNNKYISSHTISKFYRSPAGDKPFVLGNKSLREGVQEPNCVMYWERGSNVIKGLDFFNWHGISNIIYSTTQQGVPFISFSQVQGGSTYYYKIIFGEYKTNSDIAGYIEPDRTKYSLLDTYFRVKYVPMTDLKIKYDNSGIGKDVQLYNQNGRITDGVALSKLLLSYKDEILSDNITKYAVGYNFEDMPKVGDIVKNGNNKYVINNVSLDFFQNEKSGYFIVGEFTLSKNVATKSLLTSPNTNIRDYGIPQNYNVQRKQLYRDFYELSFTVDSNADNDRYLSLSKVWNTRVYATEYIGHTAIMKLTYDESFGGGGGTYDGGVAPSNNKWYYQLDSTIYFMKKAMYEVIDFQDNNIIGYDSQNVSCGFDIRRLFDVINVGSGNIDTVNTPISYVDTKGKFKGIDMALCNIEQLKDIYDTYKDVMESQLGRTYNGVLYNRCVFIPYDIYNMAIDNAYHDIRINESDYDKDALEVPVFEYSCQIDDSEDVIIGDDILETSEDDNRYIYEALVVSHGIWDNNSWSHYFTAKNISISNHVLTLDDTSETKRKPVLFTISDSSLEVAQFESVGIKDNAEGPITGDMGDIYSWLSQQSGDVDLAVVRYTIRKNHPASNGVITNPEVELMFVIKHAKNCPHDEYSLSLKINHYKLK